MPFFVGPHNKGYNKLESILLRKLPHNTIWFPWRPQIPVQGVFCGSIFWSGAIALGVQTGSNGGNTLGLCRAYMGVIWGLHRGLYGDYVGTSTHIRVSQSKTLHCSVRQRYRKTSQASQLNDTPL